MYIVEKQLKISIVTVSYNAARTIEQTICSVINQTYSNIEYIIIDGASTDGTVDIIKKYEDSIAYWVSEPDGGMYEALTKGFKHVTGDIVAYINADDFYQPNVFHIVSEVFSNNADVKWIVGLNAHYNIHGNIVKAWLPCRYKRDLIRKGAYLGKLLPWIQQESTFWRVDLLDLIDYNELSRFKYAGDYYIWQKFSTSNNLYVLSALISGFRISAGQLSSNLDAYYKECSEMGMPALRIVDYLHVLYERLFYLLPFAKRDDVIKYDFLNDVWHK